MFTRQHYEKLARYINENEVYVDGYPNDGPYGIDSLCRFFKQDNLGSTFALVNLMALRFKLKPLHPHRTTLTATGDREILTLQLPLKIHP